MEMGRVLSILAVVMTASTVCAQSPDRAPANPLRMQGGGWLGVMFSDQPVAVGGPGGVGVVVTEIVPGSPGSMAGFLRGDVVTVVGKVSVRELLGQVQGQSISVTGTVNEALTSLRGVSRLKFEVVRGGQRVDVFTDLSGSPERHLLFVKVRERSTQQLRQVDLATRQLSDNASEYEQARITGSLAPMYREYNRLLQEIINTGDAELLESRLTDAINDRRLEVFHRLVAFLQVVGIRGTLIPTAYVSDYRTFDTNLKTLVPSRAHFDQTLMSLTPSQLHAARSALRFIEPHGDARERLAQVEQRLAAHEARGAQDSKLVAMKSELLASLQSGVRNQELEDRIARLPPEGRRSMEDFRRQMLARRGEAEAAEQKRKHEEAAAEAERRKRDEANDAIFEQLKEAKRQREEREREERERIAAERSNRLREYGATHVSFGDEVHDNPFRFQGHTVCFKNVRFKRMIEAGVGVFQTRGGRELLISRLPVDAFKRAGQGNSVVAKVLGRQSAQTASGRTVILVHAVHVAVLPESGCD
jgi:hypothetical protein